MREIFKVFRLYQIRPKGNGHDALDDDSNTTITEVRRREARKALDAFFCFDHHAFNWQ